MLQSAEPNLAALPGQATYAAATTIPTIDLGPCLENRPGALERIARDLGDASATAGFYFIRNHGVPQSLIDRVFAESKRFHHLPLERKSEVKVADEVIGYVPLGGQTPVHGSSKDPDRNASYYMRREFAPDDPDRLAKRPWVFDNRWPRDLPGFRETMLEYFDAMAELGRRILVLQSVALGLGPHYLPSHPAFRPPSSSLRLLHYPPRDALLEGQFGNSPHTDFGHSTILAQGEQPGLDIELSTGWVSVPVLEGHLLVNNGDMLRFWSNDRFHSPRHRVINRSGKERFSVPFFIAPREDVVLGCLPSCQGPDNPPRYRARSWGQYFAQVTRSRVRIEGAREIGPPHAGLPASGRAGAFVPAPAAALPTNDGSGGSVSAEQEVRQIHEERIAAFVAGDVGKLDKIMAANVVFISPLGQVQRKDSLIADLASGNLKVERFETNDLNISVSGQTAVATYRVSTRASYKGQPRNGQYMMMSVYGNEGGRWMLVGQQSTQLAPPPQTQPSPAR